MNKNDLDKISINFRKKLYEIDEKESLTEGSYNADKYETYRIFYYEGSYQYKAEYFPSRDKKEVEKHALTELKNQYLYRPTDKNLWAEIDLPVKWVRASSVSYKK